MCGQGLTIPNASALALAPFTRLTGSASALLGSIQLAMGAIASAIVSIFHARSELPMIVVMFSCVLLSLACYWLGNKRTSSLEKMGQAELAEII